MEFLAENQIKWVYREVQDELCIKALFDLQESFIAASLFLLRRCAVNVLVYCLAIIRKISQKNLINLNYYEKYLFFVT